MAQSQIQEQKLEQRLQQSVSQLQLLQAQLIEMPVTQLVERIETEMNDNPALETRTDDDGDWHDDLAEEGGTDDDFDTQREREERQSALDEALAGIGRDDEELPVYSGGQPMSEEREEMNFSEQTSFQDQLHDQLRMIDLSEREHNIMEYLIGSLDDDGLLRKSLYTISDELAIYQNIDASPQEIEHVLKLLQDFDPAGIGARSLQECLLLQIGRREDSLSLNDLQAEALQKELRRLNPKPGASMGEAIGRSLQQITPDFIVDTQDDGTISFTLNNNDVPQLQVSQSFADLLNEYQQNKDALSRQMKEALLYTKKKVEAAQNFIDAVMMRRRTLTLTMRAIIQLQHRFFEDGDEASLRPMILKDVAEKTGLDLSTISRVSNSKYAQTRWGTFPLRFFFSDGITTESGEEFSTREIKATLRDIVESEDKHKPLSDDALSEQLAQRGYPIARRTVAKYREQLGIPVARLRKS